MLSGSRLASSSTSCLGSVRVLRNSILVILPLTFILLRLVDEEVKIVQTGTSSLTPEKIAESWQAAAATANNLNQSLNKMNVNGKITRILFLSTRTDPRQEVELEASREPDSKVTQVKISSPLPKPEIGSE